MASKITLERGSIEATMLGPLWARATYSKLYPDILNDQLAIDIISKIDYDFTEISEYLEEFRALGLMVRARSFDIALLEYIKRNPNTVVVNIGCGLDTTFSRVDNGKIKWYNLDLPNAIKFRQQFILDAERNENINKSAFDLAWFDEIEFNPKNGIFFIMGGFVYYFTQHEIISFLISLAGQFPGGEIIFDTVSKTAIRIINRRASKADTDVRMYFGVKNPKKLFTRINPNIELKDSFSIWSRTLLNSNWSNNTIKMIKLTERLKTASIVHLEFL